MSFYKYFIIIFFLVYSTFSFAKSCEANGTCRGRFEIQSDPYDFNRESSRAHQSIFFISNFGVNRFMESQYSFSKQERILYSALILTAVGIGKEFIYDPDGFSRSDFLNNSLGILISATFEWTLF